MVGGGFIQTEICIEGDPPLCTSPKGVVISPARSVDWSANALVSHKGLVQKVAKPSLSLGLAMTSTKILSEINFSILASWLCRNCWG